MVYQHGANQSHHRHPHPQTQTHNGVLRIITARTTPNTRTHNPHPHTHTHLPTQTLTPLLPLHHRQGDGGVAHSGGHVHEGHVRERHLEEVGAHVDRGPDQEPARRGARDGQAVRGREPALEGEVLRAGAKVEEGVLLGRELALLLVPGGRWWSKVVVVVGFGFAFEWSDQVGSGD